MSRNAESRFALNPTNVEIQRSMFDRNCTYKTSFNVGDLIPFYVDEVLPGDTHQIKTNKIVRMQPLVSSPMDDLYLDTYYFFVPNRLVWEHWKQFNGENTESAWIPETQYSIPQITAPAGGWSIGTIADYMGIPTGVANLSVSALPFRAYALIVNEWFRDENVQQPLNIPFDDTTVTGVNTGDQVKDIAKGGKPFVAAKYHDYFTSVLPSPQKGPDVVLSLSGPGDVALTQSQVDKMSAPVFTRPTNVSPPSNIPSPFVEPLHIRPSTGSSDYKDSYSYDLQAVANSTKYASVYTVEGSSSSPSVASSAGFIPYNLEAYLGGVQSFPIATINQLRTAFQIQRLYEKDARGGTRYIEILKSHFGVTSPDARLQRPEYLGGNRIAVNFQQVVQTSETATTPQANVAGYSLTADSNGDFTRSFTEHGYIIGLAVARYPHTYQQGIARHWSRKTRFDFYWPVLANLGEQAVLNKELYAQGTAKDDEVFGYQEAWSEYRYKPSMVTGEMRSSAETSLDSWHFADDYSQLPTLSSEWIAEDKSNIDRALAVSSEVSNQLFADFYIQNTTTRPMPMYSIPGLIDHN